MLTEIYIEALLVDEELADQVWKAWIAEKLTDAAMYSLDAHFKLPTGCPEQALYSRPAPQATQDRGCQSVSPD